MKPEERSLIDRYLENTLSGIELKLFMDRMAEDEIFRSKVSFRNLIIESIKLSDDERIEKNILAYINYRKPRIPSGLKMIIIFFGITLAGIVLWEYTGTNTGHSTGKFFALDFLRKNSTAPVKTKAEEKPPLKKAQRSLPDTAGQYAPDNHAVNSVVQDMSEDTIPAEDVEVKKDQLLVTYTLNAGQPKVSDPAQQLSSSAVEKLNPAAGLSDEHAERNENQYEVEFWISPVNYKGYKLSSGKLILFGIEEPDAVKLFNIDNKLMMKYGHDYFHLLASGDFLSFTSVKETEIPSSLK